MRSVIGAIIRNERQRRGWDQAELARRLGDIGQQAVSGWERSTSRPRRNMVAQLAAVLELPVAGLLVSAGYTALTADSPADVRHPVRPLLATLPLGDLAPDRFEQFTADLASYLYPDAEVHRFGGPGHRQEGIDVVVQRDQVTEATFQCKRARQFGPTEVRAAVAKSEIEASKHFLMLTRVASPGARKEIAKHKKWVLWDLEDISRVVRSKLSLDEAVRLVDTHFPGLRGPFLGVREPGPWLTTDEFYRPFSPNSRVRTGYPS